MSTTTNNYNLIKPELTDAADITATNGNWDVIDETLKVLETSTDDKMPKSGGDFTGKVTTNQFINFKLDDTHFVLVGKSNDEFAISMNNNGSWVELVRVAKDGSVIGGNLVPKSGADLTGWLKYRSYDDLEKTDASVIRQTYIKDSAGVNVETFQIRMDRK